ncbi:MAG: hypothetical protein NTW41_09290 [Verrucomicrobia bacterium]|jgi:hypothetical protein|nr:hypothetical protein [Verrucomicrobiota bacterium]
MMQADWEIKSRAHQCSRTGREFAEGEFFYTILVREGEGFLREDMSEEAWNERNENIQPFSFWRSKYEPPAPPPAEPLPRDDAEGLLRRLIQENDPAYSNVRYILALMLERKRVIRPLESSDDDMLVYEHLATGETFVLANPKLSFERIPEVQREVSALLDPSA